MLNASKASILNTLFFCTGQGKKTYTQVSINKLLALLLKHHNIDIKRSWIFQCLRDIEDSGYIRRKRRYLQVEGGLIQGIPSLWSFTLKGLSWLVANGVTPAIDLYKNMISWLQKKEGRFPRKEDFFDPSYTKIDVKAIERLKQLAGSVTKDIT
jgi:hypothetical protein